MYRIIQCIKNVISIFKQVDAMRLEIEHIDSANLYLSIHIKELEKKIEKLQQWVAGHETLLKTDGDWNKAMKDLNNIKQ